MKKEYIFLIIGIILLILFIIVLGIKKDKYDESDRLKEIHKKIKDMPMNSELSEQKMVIKYLPKNSKVLEIGGNIGRNSMVISYLITDQKNLVVLESDPKTAEVLKQNRDKNGRTFHIEASALSKRPLTQQYTDLGEGSRTADSEDIPEGHFKVNTITYTKLEEKYKIQFNAIVADCEGALYYILKDEPTILKNINILIVENDYYEKEHKEYVDSLMEKYEFKRIHFEGGGWGPCKDNFFEVWEKSKTIGV